MGGTQKESEKEKTARQKGKKRVREKEGKERKREREKNRKTEGRVKGIANYGDIYPFLRSVGVLEGNQLKGLQTKSQRAYSLAALFCEIMDVDSVSRKRNIAAEAPDNLLRDMGHNLQFMLHASMWIASLGLATCTKAMENAAMAW